MEHQKNFDKEPKEKEFVEKLVTLNRTSKTVKGGRRMAFAALVVKVPEKDVTQLLLGVSLVKVTRLVTRERLLTSLLLAVVRSSCRGDNRVKIC